MIASLGSLPSIRNYSLTNLLGIGSFAKVYETEDARTQTQWAIKIIPQCSPDRARMKITLSPHLDHPSFPKFHEAMSDRNFHYVVQEFLPNGTLLQQLNQQHTFSERDERIIFAQILDWVQYLHNEHQVAHVSSSWRTLCSIVHLTSKLLILKDVFHLHNLANL
jgi:serine/threonine protein kinase